MRVCELMRRVIVGPMTIHLTIEADSPCEHWQDHADEVALLVSTLADEDDRPSQLAEKIDLMFSTVTAVSVMDDDGNGVTLRDTFQGGVTREY